MILIYGKGKVGNGLYNFCKDRGLDCDICDDSDAPDSFDAYDSIIPSPGIPSSHPIYSTGKIMCEMDFLYPYIPDGFLKICVTGTDGKSSTCHILHEFLKNGLPDIPSYVTGNNDESLATTLSEILKRGEASGVLVIEVSSFMSYALHMFESDISILTNLHPDHLDWHTDLAEYIQAKMNLFRHTSGLILFPDEHPLVKNSDMSFPVETWVKYYNGKESENRVELPFVYIGEEKIDTTQSAFQGYYNASNILVASLAALKAGVDILSIKDSLKTIMGLPHRVELIGDVGGRRWIEDSKSTTSQSQRAALEGMPDGATVLIAGGKDKGDTFEGIEKYWQQKCRHVILIGQMSEKLAGIAEESGIAHTQCNSLEEGVDLAYRLSKSGDTILLSPGCSSLDMFDDYLDRANKFREGVASLV